MSPKRPLEVVLPPETPRKRLRRAGRLVTMSLMWLRPKANMRQMVLMVRQVKVELARMCTLLMALVLQFGTIQTQLFEQRTVQSFIVERLDGLQRIMEGMRRDQPGLIQSAVRTEMQDIRAASLSNGVHQHPRNPTICRPQLNVIAIPEGLEQTGGRYRMVQLRFVNNSPKSTQYTDSAVEWQNGTIVKVAIFENDNQITQGDLSRVTVDILVVHSEFFTKRRQENFTKEEFDKQICISGDKELVLITFNLNNGEGYLDSICFTESSHRKEWRLAARVKSQVPRIRFEEAVTDPFVVKVGRSKIYAKSYPPMKEDDVHRLVGISPKGKFRDNLVGKGITKVKQLLRHYHIDGSALQELIGMKNEAWKDMIEHAKTCHPGTELYAYSAMEENYELFFDDFYDLVGVKRDGEYTTYRNLDNSQQDKANSCKTAAYRTFEELEKSGSLTREYKMINGLPSLVQSNGVGPSTQPTLTSQQYSHYQNQAHQFAVRFGQCQPSPHQNGSYLSASILQNNVAIPSAQETLASKRSYDQNVDKEIGPQSPFTQQNGPSYQNFQGNVLNVQGQYDDLVRDSSQGVQINGCLHPSTSAGTDIVDQQTYSLSHGEAVFFDEQIMLLGGDMGYHDPLLANNEELAISNTPLFGDDVNMDDFSFLPSLPDPSF